MNIDRGTALLLAYRVSMLALLAWIAMELNDINRTMPGSSSWDIEQIRKEVARIDEKLDSIVKEGIKVNREPTRWSAQPLPPLPPSSLPPLPQFPQ